MEEPSRDSFSYARDLLLGKFILHLVEPLFRNLGEHYSWNLGDTLLCSVM